MNVATFRKLLPPLEIVFIVGLFIRLWFAVYTNYIAVYAKFRWAEAIFHGDNVLIRGAAFGPALHFFFAPLYANFMLLVSWGINYEFFVIFLFKLPAIIADIIIMYAFYGIAMHVSGDKKKALVVASAYFLNPYIIWASALQGFMEHMTIAFIMLSLLYLLRGRMGLSAASLAFSMATRQFPILLLPAFIAFIWMKYRSWAPNLSRFVKAFLASAVIINAPYIYIAYRLALHSTSAFISYPMLWFGTTTTLGHEASTFDFGYNFTGILASLDVWRTVSIFFGGRVFLLLAALSIVFLLRYGRPTAEWINQNIMVIYILFILTTPLVEASFLQWVLPSLLLAAILFRSLPWYYPHVIWISSMLIEPLPSASFTYSLDQTFPYFFPIRDPEWPFRNLPLYLSFSALHSLFLILALSSCFLIVYIRRRQKKLTAKHADTGDPLRETVDGISLASQPDRRVILLFSMYSIYEILRVSFGLGSGVLSSILGGVLVFAIWSYTYRGTRHEHSIRQLLQRTPYTLYLVSLLIIFLTVWMFSLDLPVFLLVQLIILTMLWSSHRQINVISSVTRLSLIFTILYVFYLLLTSLNPFLGRATILFISSCFYLQFMTDLRLSASKSVVDER